MIFSNKKEKIQKASNKNIILLLPTLLQIIFDYRIITQSKTLKKNHIFL